MRKLTTNERYIIRDLIGNNSIPFININTIRYDKEEAFLETIENPNPNRRWIYIETWHNIFDFYIPVYGFYRCPSFSEKTIREILALDMQKTVFFRNNYGVINTWENWKRKGKDIECFERIIWDIENNEWIEVH